MGTREKNKDKQKKKKKKKQNKVKLADIVRIQLPEIH